MKYAVLAVGRIKKSPEKDLFDSYAKRLPAPLEMIEVEEKRAGPPAEKKEREGKLLLDALPKGAFVIALDERGKDVASAGLAAQIEKCALSGYSKIVFVIGGADGLSCALLDRANMKICLGKMTWPHMLVRTLIAEQIYRAESILSGHPYHRA